MFQHTFCWCDGLHFGQHARSRTTVLKNVERNLLQLELQGCRSLIGGHSLSGLSIERYVEIGAQQMVIFADQIWSVN